MAFAKIESGVVNIGALGCPELGNCSDSENSQGGTLAVAIREGGSKWSVLEQPQAWLPLKVSHRRKVAEARLLRSVESAHTNTGEIGELVSTLGICGPAVPLDSQAKYALLASGTGDALLRLLSPSRPDYRERIWDQAAGSIIVEEAGGRVTDLDGKPLDFSHGRGLEANRGILATNGQLHEEILAGLKEIGA